MRRNTRCDERLHELIDTDLPADERERLAWIDALLRITAGRDPAQPASHPPPGEQSHEMKLSFDQLALIYKSLLAVKTRGTLPPQDELLNDTLQLVDLALSRAI